MRKSVSSSKAITSTKDLQPPTNRQPKTYEATDHGLIRWEYRNGEWTPIQIANFTARVIEDLRVDDGVDVRHELRVEAVLKGGKSTEVIVLPSAKFDRMNWMTSYLGIGAIVNAGCERHVRAAIKYLSLGQYSSRDVYRQTGWRKVGNRMLYLHSTGAIGKAGAVRSIETRLSKDLNDFTLPDPPRTLARLSEVTSALLRFLDVAPDRITVPLLSAVPRAILGQANFSLHLVAQYGSGKSVLAAPIQQCFAPAMHNKNLHITWESTENFLEQVAFEAKDAVLVMDDFKPNGTPQQKQEWHAKADRVLRAQGNRAGRGRLNADLETVGSKPPRGLILSTGEEIPNGASLQTRMVVLELGPYDVDKKVLTQVQEDAGAGMFAEATAAFIRWLPAHFDRVEPFLFAELNRYRRIFHGNSKGLKRAPDNIFELAIAFRIFLSFVLDMKVLTQEQVEALWRRATKGYGEMMRTQQAQQSISDPCIRFFELIGSLINSGQGYIASGKTGWAPSNAASRWGWKEREDGKPGLESQGICLGWIHKEGLFLPETIVWPALVDLAQRCGERFDISFTQLKRQLCARKLLLSSDIETKRRVFTVRKICAGKEQHTLLHVAPNTVLGGEGSIFADKSDKSLSPDLAWEKLSDFSSFLSGERKANRQILQPNNSTTSPPLVGNVGSFQGDKRIRNAGTLKRLKQVLDSSSAVEPDPTDLSDSGLSLNGHTPPPSSWQSAGFESAQAFEKWYEALYAAHPTRGGLNIGLHELAELIAAGTFQREAFEAGYQSWRQSAAWTRKEGRFIPKLCTFIQDRGWNFPPVELAKPKTEEGHF